MLAVPLPPLGCSWWACLGAHVVQSLVVKLAPLLSAAAGGGGRREQGSSEQEGKEGNCLLLLLAHLYNYRVSGKAHLTLYNSPLLSSLPPSSLPPPVLPSCYPGDSLFADL